MDSTTKTRLRSIDRDGSPKSDNLVDRKVRFVTGSLLYLLVNTICIAFLIGIPLGMVMRQLATAMFHPNPQVTVVEDETE